MVSDKIDKAGFCTSAVCAVHCALTPALLFISGSAGMMTLFTNPVIEMVILILTIAVGLMSFIPAYFRHHRPYVMVLFVAGILLVVNGELIGILWVQLVFSLAGAAVLAYAHFENLKLLKARG